MKKILSILLALALMLGAAFALAEGNVTIAVQGMNDFNDYIQSMVVYGDRLLLSSWDRLYTWDNATRKLTEVDGYSELESTLTGDGETPGVLDLNDGDTPTWTAISISSAAGSTAWRRSPIRTATRATSLSSC